MLNTEVSPGSQAELLEAATVEMRPPRILLAEDDADMRTLVREALEDEGYDVVEAADGNELLDRLADDWLASDGFDLLLSDVRLPGCSGLRALEALRQRDWHTPALFMTAFGDDRTHAEAYRLGATVLDKPFGLEDLFQMVRTLVPPARYQNGWR